MKLTDFFFPPICPICNGYAPEGAVCKSCDEKLSTLFKTGVRKIKIGEGVISAYYISEYDSEELKKYIFALKKRSDRALFCHAAMKITNLLKEIPVSQGMVITNIPRRKKNIREFGYDHAQKISKEIAKLSCGSLKYMNIIKRRGFSVDQKNLGAKERQENATGKFYSLKKKNIKSIIIFDDVITTGSSFCEAVRVLKARYGNDVEIAGAFLASSKQKKQDYM